MSLLPPLRGKRVVAVLDGVRYEGILYKRRYSKKKYLVIDGDRYDYYVTGVIHRRNNRAVFRRNGMIFIEIKPGDEIATF